MSNAAQQRLPEVGDTIAGKYRLTRKIAEGGMGVVFEAVHRRLGQHVAIKIVYPRLSANAELAARFEREGRIAPRLESPNVARVLDMDQLPDGLLYMVMELLKGHDLEAELQARRALPVAEAADYVRQAALAMRDAHALGVVHRDLKPANLFLCDVPDTPRKLVKVLDFGISRVVHDGASKLTDDFQTMGTAFYMSPEQIKAASHVDARSDVWSLGVILYELLTGRVPFEGAVTKVLVAIATEPVTPPRQLRPDIPAELEAVILRALAKAPQERFQTTDELAAALEPFAPAEAVEALAARIRRDAMAPQIVSQSLAVDVPPRRFGAATILGASLAVAAVVVGVPLYLRTRPAADGAPPRSADPVAAAGERAEAPPTPPPAPGTEGEGDVAAKRDAAAPVAEAEPAAPWSSAAGAPSKRTTPARRPKRPPPPTSPASPTNPRRL